MIKPDSTLAPNTGKPDDLRHCAARFLVAGTPAGAMTEAEALRVVDLMRPIFAQAGTLVMEEGDSAEGEYMALVLEGEVRAESGAGTIDDQVLMSLNGPGTLIGEMGVIDGSPRSARCVAQSDTKLAILTHQSLMGLLRDDPSIAARLMLVIAGSMARRLRETNRRLRTVSQVERMTQSELGKVQRELDAAHAINRRLLEQDKR